MNKITLLTLHMLRFMLSFKSVLFLLFSGLIMTIFFSFGTEIAEGYGYSSLLYILGGSLPVPYLLISSTYNTIFMIGSIGLVMITFQFCEFLLFGHISHSVIGRFKSRLSVINAFLISLWVLTLPLSLLFIAHYFAIADSFQQTLFLILISWLYTFTLTLMTVLVLNFNVFRKAALFVMILTFLVAPATLMIMSNGLNSMGGIYSFISAGLAEVYSFLGLHFQLSRFIDFTISSSFTNWSELLGLLVYIIPYWIIIIVGYQRKEFT